MRSVEELDIEQALIHLQLVRDILKRHQCPKALARVRLALSSVKGALRNAGYRRMGVERGRKKITRAPKVKITRV